MPAQGSSTTSRRSPTIPARSRLQDETGLPVVLMHAQGDPRTMQVDPRYDDVVLDVYDWLAARIEACEARRHPALAPRRRSRHRLRQDARPQPGADRGLEHLPRAGLRDPARRLAQELHRADWPLEPEATASGAPIAAALAGAAQGVQILRVHDVAATRQALAVWEASRSGSTWISRRWITGITLWAGEQDSSLWDLQLV